MNKDAELDPIAALTVLAVLVLAVGVALWGIEGPASRCEFAGGQMLVGPGGETACVSRRTFLPLDHFDEGESGNASRP